MSPLVILFISVVVLFLLAFVSRRRFGVLGLALASGYVLQRLWESDFPIWAEFIPFPETSVFSPLTIIGLIVLLLPSVILLFGGPAYKNTTGRIFGSALYALLAVLFGMGALVGSMNLSGDGRLVYDFVMQNRDYILTAALIAAVIDVTHSQTSKKGPTKKK